MIRGVRFNPETPVGDDWLSVYPTMRCYVIREMRELRETVPSITHLVVTLVSGRHFAYPTPQPERLGYLGMLLADAAAAGYKVILLIATPCTLPQSFAAAAGAPEHVGGHSAGEVVQGWTLYWDVPPCPDGCQHTSAAWFCEILRGVASYHPVIEHVEIGGNHSIPFATEAGPLWSPAYRAKVCDYVRTVFNAVRAEFPAIRLGVSLIAIDGRVDEVQFAAENAPGLDVYSASCDVAASIPALAAIVGASKLVVADFKLLDAPRDTALWLVAQCERYGVLGWWIWEYRQAGNGALRASTAQGGAWDRRLVDLLNA